MKRAWWKEAVVYQIYPRSFYDSNGDGIGDLPGILAKVAYIASLGVDAVWLNPIFRSPNDDGGYDISDYYSLQPEFGSLADFDALLEALHSRGIRLIMDLVLNHSSDEHPWFVESRQNVDNPRRHYYFWRTGRGEAPPNNWPSFFGGSAWAQDESTGEYYLHLFSRKQPDLNWETDALREELANVMEFWLKRGVDGLRLDVISAISKRTDFPDTDTTDFNETIRKYYANGPRLQEFLREMRHRVWNRFEVMTVGEGPGITPHNAMQYLHPQDGLNMIFHFGHMFIDQGPGGRFDPVPWTMAAFKEVFTVWDEALKNGGWGSVFLGNHDFARMVSRWGNDGAYRIPSSKLLLTLLLTMRGTPFVFAGDELGMTNTRLTSVSESRDVETRNGWIEAAKRGLSESDFLVLANYAGRDNARTPFQWSAGAQAGFTSATPWMPVNPNYRHINASAQEVDSDSVLAYFRQLTHLRKQCEPLVYGDFTWIDAPIERLLIYSRATLSERMVIVLNFSDEHCIFDLAHVAPGLQRLSGNYRDEEPGKLRPWEATIYRIQA